MAGSYDGSTYMLTFRHCRQNCFGHCISTKALRALMLAAIRTVSAFAVANEAESIAKAQAELDAFKSDTTRADRFLALTNKYANFSVLTTPMIYRLEEAVRGRKEVAEKDCTEV
jgi:hypothetical protein